MSLSRWVHRGVLMLVAGFVVSLAHAGASGSATELPRELAFRNLDTTHGLANDVVLALAQDGPGLIWIATFNGVSRFDGLKVRNYLHNPDDATSLSANLTRDLAIGDDRAQAGREERRGRDTGPRVGAAASDHR